MSDPVPLSAVYDASANGRSLVSAADYAAMRTLLSTYSAAQVDAAISAAVGAIDLSGYAALTGATFTGAVSVDANRSGADYQSLEIDHTQTGILGINAAYGGSASQPNLRFGYRRDGGAVNTFFTMSQLYSEAYLRGNTGTVYIKLGWNNVEIWGASSPSQFLNCSSAGWRFRSNLPVQIANEAGTGSGRLRVSKTSTSSTNFEAFEIDSASDADYHCLTALRGSAGGLARGIKIGGKQDGGSFVSWLTLPSTGPAVLATGTGATVDDVISLLQSLSLCKQS